MWRPAQSWPQSDILLLVILNLSFTINASFIGEYPFRDNFIWDSGMMTYVCNQRDIFITFAPIVETWIYIGNTQLEVEGWGIVKIPTLNDSSISKINLLKTVYIPIFYINLIAASKVLNARYN